MGIITLALYTAGEIDSFEVPFWVVLAAAAAISAGTYAGGTTLNQPSLLATDMVNRAVAFNGSSGRVSVPSSTALQFTNAFSLEAWIKPTSLPSSGVFRSVLTKGESYSLQFNGPRLEFTIMRDAARYRARAHDER